MKALVVVLVFVVSGCATPRNPTGVGMTPVGPGAQVDIAQAREDMRSGEAFWRTQRDRYVNSWRDDPYKTAVYTAGAALGVYVIGDWQGWWGGSSGGGGNSDTYSDTRSTEARGGRDTVVIINDGDGNTFNVSPGDSTSTSTF